MECNNKASEIQVGGDHYRKLAYQPIKLITEIGCSFCQGNIIKYTARWRYKNGIEDLRKARHYCQLALEFKDWHPCRCPSEIQKFIGDNGIDLEEASVIWHAAEGRLHDAIAILDRIIDSELSINRL